MADLSTEILKSIRDQLENVGERITETREELSAGIGETNQRLDRLERRQTETEIRLATELTEVAKAVNQLTSAILDDRQSA